MANKYDYRELRQIINANHDRFSSLNYDTSMTLQQKMNSMVEWFKVVLKEFNDVIKYLDDFKENFDENLYTTVLDILNKWLEDGVMAEIVNEVFKVLKGKPFNILVWENKLGDNEDWTPIFQEALETYGVIYVPPRENGYKVYGMVSLPNGSQINIEAKTTIYKPTDSNNNDPIFFLNESSSSIHGKSMYTSVIKSEKPSPNGVVSIGYWNMCADVGKNILYCSLKDLTVSGNKNGGETSGNPSNVIYMANPQVNGMASYFHLLQNLYIKQGNVGLLMMGWANANIINNIQFYAVGNEKYLAGAAIKMVNVNGKSPLDNVISNVFHHQSTNAVTLFLDGGVGFNSITNINSEQGGAGGTFLLENGGSKSNIISGIDNVSQGSKVSEDFYYLNTFNARSRMALNELSVNTFKFKSLSSDNLTVDNEKINIMGEKKYKYERSGLKENTEYELMKVSFGGNKNISGIIDYSLLTRGSNAKTLLKTSFIKVGYRREDSGDFMFDFLIGDIDNLIKLKQVDNSLVFYCTTPNNNTSVTSMVATSFMTLYGASDSVVVEKVV